MSEQFFSTLGQVDIDSPWKGWTLPFGIGAETSDVIEPVISQSTSSPLT